MTKLIERLLIVVTSISMTLLIAAPDAQAAQGPLGWATDSSNTQRAVYAAGQTGTDPYEGNMFGSVRATAPNGSIYQDVARAINPGESFCADAVVVTQGMAAGG